MFQLTKTRNLSLMKTKTLTLTLLYKMKEGTLFFLPPSWRLRLSNSNRTRDVLSFVDDATVQVYNAETKATVNYS